MATYKGNDIIKPDQLDTDIKRTMQPRPGLENIEQDLNLPEEAGPDYVPRPGQKGYMGTKPMADTIRGELPPRAPRGELPPRAPRGELPPRVGDPLARSVNRAQEPAVTQRVKPSSMGFERGTQDWGAERAGQDAQSADEMVARNIGARNRVSGYKAGGEVTPVAAPGAGIDPEWEKFQRENEAGRKANRARKIEQHAPLPTPGAGSPGQGYRPYGSDTSTDKFNQGGMVTKHGSSTHVSCSSKHR